ncbi:MAG TPA: MOSC domain-containing protein [Methylomirabilota bacterium]|nr:MOSC domain-containing protein [Methylomirabilota bacterium]
MSEEWNGQVIAIQITSSAGEKMVSIREVKAIAGKGLEGDRYLSERGKFSDKPGPARQLTLIELEAIEALQREDSIELSPLESRRNIVTRGVPLNHLVNKRFRLGDVVARGVKLCEPCEYLEEVTQKKVISGLTHRGGLRAEILQGGIIRVGDKIQPA